MPSDLAPIPLPDTVLVLSSMGIPLYSARGLKQTWAPIGEAGFVLRDINGELCDLGDENFDKIATVISGEDVRSPAFNDIRIGKLLTVDCIFELAYLTSGGSPQFSVVSGSSYVEGDFTRYRPQMIGRVVSFEADSDEWESITTWSLGIEQL
jgi:hypothetical protein